jgi:hypothetical protein
MTRSQRVQNQIDAATAAESESLLVDDFAVPEGRIAYVPSGQEVAVLDLTVKAGATLVVEGRMIVFGTTSGTGTVTGSGTVENRSV